MVMTTIATMAVIMMMTARRMMMMMMMTRRHTSYLSQTQAPQAVPVEKNSAMWRNYRLTAEIVPFKCGENLSHGEISPHEKCGDKSVSIMCTIFDVLSHFMLFCCKIFLLCDLRCFVAKSVLSWFTRFGVEKNRAKNCDCGEKRTNMRYAQFIPIPECYKR